jgi:hypothetical protein
VAGVLSQGDGHSRQHQHANNLTIQKMSTLRREYMYKNINSIERKTYRILHFASFFNESWMKSMALAVFVDPLLYSNALIS